MRIPLSSQLEFSSPSPRISPTAHSAALIPFALISMFLNLGYKVAPTQPPAIEAQLQIHRLHSWNKCVCNYRGEMWWELSEIHVRIVFLSCSFHKFKGALLGFSVMRCVTNIPTCYRGKTKIYLTNSKPIISFKIPPQLWVNNSAAFFFLNLEELNLWFYKVASVETNFHLRSDVFSPGLDYPSNTHAPPTAALILSSQTSHLFILSIYWVFFPSSTR